MLLPGPAYPLQTEAEDARQLTGCLYVTCQYFTLT